jgi:transcription termination factor NusB
MYALDIKRCAQQLVKESFIDIISGNFKIPSEKEMEKYLKKFIDYAFDDYQVTRKVIGSHPGWGQEMVTNEVERLKRRYDKEYYSNLVMAVNRTVEEIENLLRGLEDTIKKWKIKNLD